MFNGLLLLLAGFTCRAQERSKTYKETFNVNKDTELNINTSYADIEFETWDKDQVEITATVELEGVSEEDAKSYFDRDLVKIMGNSKEIEVSTKGAGPYVFDFNGMHFDFPEVPSVAEIMADIEIPEMPEIAVLPSMPPLPPMPPTPFVEFDYDAYKKDKDKYMKEWSENLTRPSTKSTKKVLRSGANRWRNWPRKEMGEGKK